MATNNRIPESEKRNFAEIGHDSRSNIYLPAIAAAIAMAVALVMAVSCSKQSASTEARISAPQAPAVEIPSAPATTPKLPETAKKIVRKPRPTTATYVNGTYGVSFSYPRKYSLEAGGAHREMPVDSGFVKPGAVEIASVDLPDSGYPDTDFSSALINVSVNPALSREECEKFAGAPEDKSAAIGGETPHEPGDAAATSDAALAQPVQSDQAPSAVKVGANEFRETEQMKPAGDRQSDVEYFHVFRNGACYEFALDVETSRKAGEDLAQVDRGKVFGQLAKILATAKIKDVELPGMDKADQPEAAISSQPVSAGEPAAGGEPAGRESPSSAQPTEKSQVVAPERK